MRTAPDMMARCAFSRLSQRPRSTSSESIRFMILLQKCHRSVASSIAQSRGGRAGNLESGPQSRFRGDRTFGATSLFLKGGIGESKCCTRLPEALLRVPEGVQEDVIIRHRLLY